MKGTPSTWGAVALALALATSGTRATADGGKKLTVRVSPFRSAKGSLVCRLFTGPDGFPAKGYKRVESVPVAAKSAECAFGDLPPGTYAVAVFHDENGNGKLDTNFLGLPAEGVGTSNNRRPLVGPPTWEGSKFELRDDSVIDIVLRY
jgi:uncharacterized protein (DUF2141 family)